MKKTILTIAFIAIAIITKAQVTTGAFQINYDPTQYTVGTAFDTTFVRHLQFDLSDTVNISNVQFTLTDIATGNTVTTNSIAFSGIAKTANLNVANAAKRNKKTVTISLGKLPANKRYRTSIKLNDLQNKQMSTGLFEF